MSLRSLILSLSCLAASASHAYQWQEIGTASAASLDKTYVDIESIAQQDGYRMVSLMTVYEKPKPTAKGLMHDRNTKKAAFDCAQRKFAILQTIAYMDGKPVGASPPNPDWRNGFLALPASNFGKRLHETVCNAPLRSGAAESAPPTVAAPQPALPPPAAPQAGARPPAPLLVPARTRPRMSSGSGIAVTRDGYILTNKHVVEGCRKIYVKGLRTQDMESAIAALDPRNDLALLKAPLEFAQVAQFRPPTKPVRLGESIGVIGYPLTGLLSSEPKATFGQVSSVAGIANDYTLMQISAPIQGGNSGGPVLDGSGAVIGVVVSQLSAQAMSTGAVPQNVNFAVRAELAQMFMAAHGIKFAESTAQRKKLETDELADAGQQFTTLVLCTRE